jgi:hypothetical protein
MKEIKLNIDLMHITPFPVSPKGEMIDSESHSYSFRGGDEIVQLLPPWGKVGKGVKKSFGVNSIYKTETLL